MTHFYQQYLFFKSIRIYPPFQHIERALDFQLKFVFYKNKMHYEGINDFQF